MKQRKTHVSTLTLRWLLALCLAAPSPLWAQAPSNSSINNKPLVAIDPDVVLAEDEPADLGFADTFEELLELLATPNDAAASSPSAPIEIHVFEAPDQLDEALEWLDQEALKRPAAAVELILTHPEVDPYSPETLEFEPVLTGFERLKENTRNLVKKIETRHQFKNLRKKPLRDRIVNYFGHLASHRQTAYKSLMGSTRGVLVGLVTGAGYLLTGLPLSPSLLSAFTAGGISGLINGFPTAYQQYSTKFKLFTTTAAGLISFAPSDNPPLQNQNLIKRYIERFKSNYAGLSRSPEDTLPKTALNITDQLNAFFLLELAILSSLAGIFYGFDSPRFESLGEAMKSLTYSSILATGSQGFGDLAFMNDYQKKKEDALRRMEAGLITPAEAQVEMDKNLLLMTASFLALSLVANFAIALSVFDGEFKSVAEDTLVALTALGVPYYVYTSFIKHKRGFKRLKTSVKSRIKSSCSSLLAVGAAPPSGQIVHQ